VEPYRIVGGAFGNTGLDTNYWALTNSASGGTATVANAQCTLASGGTADNVAVVQSARSGRYVGGASNRFRHVMRLPSVSLADHILRWGAFNASDGAFFELDNTTLKVVTRKTASDTPVSSGNFNGSVASYTIDTNNKTYEIYWTNSKVYFVIGGVLIHTVNALTTTWSDTLNLYARFEVGNYSGSTTSKSMEVRTSTIYRFGRDLTLPRYYYHAAGQTTGTVLKIGPGNVHEVIISTVSNNAVVTLVDIATAATGTPIIFTTGAMGALTTPFPIPMGSEGCPFNTGLALVVSGANAAVTVIYD
jgi:hypothetical protein